MMVNNLIAMYLDVLPSDTNVLLNRNTVLQCKVIRDQINIIGYSRLSAHNNCFVTAFFRRL